MKRYPATIIAASFSFLLCLYNYTGSDPHNMFFFMLSIPAWFVEFFIDIHEVSVLLMYVLTIISWALLGFITDRIVAKNRNKHSEPTT
ncbi:hypothetical protein EBB07_11080 [Paenibacillaceae bacterium]|nr:hypothetical protein EBB07_11080 [Paenibacillaceae bacterium]